MKGMKLKNAKLGRAENLTEETRKKFKLPKHGMIVIETWGSESDVKLKIVSCPSMSRYLKSLGDFIDIPIKED